MDKSVTLFEIYDSTTWWLAYSLIVVYLLYLKRKYILTLESLNLNNNEKRKLIKSFPSKTLRIILISTSTIYFMLVQILFYVYILKVSNIIENVPKFIVWEIFLPFCGLVAGELFAEIIQIILLPRNIKKKVKINVLHYDYLGGLKVVSQLFIALIIILSLLIISFSLSSFTAKLSGLTNPSIISFWLVAELGGGSLFLILIFTIPQLLLSKVMKENKYKELEKIHKNLIKLNISEDSQNASLKLYYLTLYQEIKKMHEYPFNLQQLEKVVLVAITPSIQGILPSLMSYLK